jgi:hypothetical protein
VRRAIALLADQRDLLVERAGQRSIHDLRGATPPVPGDAFRAGSPHQGSNEACLLTMLGAQQLELGQRLRSHEIGGNDPAREIVSDATRLVPQYLRERLQPGQVGLGV